MSTRTLARLILSSSKYCLHRNVTLPTTALCYYRECHFDGPVSWNVRYVTYSHGTDCLAQSPADGVHCFKIAKIDPIWPFYLALWLKESNFVMGKRTRSTKNETLGFKYLLFGSVYTITTGLQWKFLNFDGYLTARENELDHSLLLTEISFNNPSQFSGVF